MPNHSDVDYRAGEHPAAVAIAEKPAPQRNGVGKVEVEPVHLAVVEPIESGVQPGAQFDDGSSGMLA